MPDRRATWGTMNQDHEGQLESLAHEQIGQRPDNPGPIAAGLSSLESANPLLQRRGRPQFRAA